jgi:1-acyl-sn-glycerol-3-phosphate acyltransferase
VSYFVTEVQPPLAFIEPSFNAAVWQGARSLLPFWLRWRLKIDQVEVHNGDTLARLYQDFQSGKARFLIAFRHPSTSDPLCIAQMIWSQLPAIASQQGIRITNPHVHFVYDRGIPLWAGRPVGWLMAQLGGTPIRRGGLDRPGLRSIRQLFAQGDFPMAAAPEGGTNGHNELISPLEPGIAQFGFWCTEDVRDRDTQVFILPLGIQYHFTTAPWTSLVQLLSQLEADSGWVPPPAPATLPAIRNGQPLTPEQETWLYQRLYGLGEHLLVQLERYYIRFYQHMLPETLADALANPSQAGDTSLGLPQRLQTLLDTALIVAEQFFQLTPKGTVIDRCRRVEQAGWDRIYRNDLQLSDLSPVEQGLADRIAEEADLRLWHMRLVENFVSVTGRYVKEKPTVERFADTLLLLWKTIARIKGDRTSQIPRLGAQRVQMTVGQPLCVSDRWDDYQGNRRQAITSLTQDLQGALDAMIQT